MKGSECCAAPCRFWRKLELVSASDKPVGQCRRHAPTFDGTTYAFGSRYEGLHGTSALLNATSFPNTVADDWCGEFEADGFQGAC